MLNFVDNNSSNGQSFRLTLYDGKLRSLENVGKNSKPFHRDNVALISLSKKVPRYLKCRLFLFRWNKIWFQFLVPRVSYILSSSCFNLNYLSLSLSHSLWLDWAIYWALGNFLKPLSTINLSKYPTFLGIFCKGVKIYPFSSEIILGNFYRHLAIFFWSHCSPSLRSPSLSHPYGSFHCSSGDRTPSHTLTTYSNAFFVCEYVCEKMSIQYMGPKFELMTFGTWVSSHNH